MKLKIFLRMIGKKTKKDAGDIHKHARQVYKDV